MSSNWSRCLFGDFAIYEEELFFYNYQNALMTLDLNCNKVSYLHNRRIKMGPIEKLVKCGENLVALNAAGTRVYIYDFRGKSLSNREIDCHEKESGNIIDAASYEEKVYIFPRYKNYILILDVQQRKVQKINHDFYSRMDKNKTIIGQHNKSIYFFEQDKDSVLKYNMETNSFEERKINQILGKVVSAEFYETEFFLLYADGRVIKWNENKGTVDPVIDSVIQNDAKDYFLKCIITSKAIWLLPSLGKDIYVYRADDRKVSRYDGYPYGFAYLVAGEWGKYTSTFKYRDKTYCGMHAANHILVIEHQTGQEKWIYPIMPDVQEEISFEMGNSLTFEEGNISLEEFIHNLEMKYQDKQIERCAGENIWKATRM